VEKLLTNVKPGQVDRALAKQFLKTPVETSVNGYLVNTGSKLVLIDTLIVDRDYHKVLERADHALVLQKGQVVLQGSGAALLGDPALATYLGV